MRLVLVLLSLSAAMAQVRVQFSPEQLPPYLEARGLHPWSVRLCSTSPADRAVQPEVIYMASGAIPVIAPGRARARLAEAPKRTKRAIVADLITQGAVLATGLTGFGAIAATPKIVASIGVGVYVAGRTASALHSSAPDYSPYLDGLLESAVQLAPGACATRTVYSSRMRAADLIKVDFVIP